MTHKNNKSSLFVLLFPKIGVKELISETISWHHIQSNSQTILFSPFVWLCAN